MAVMLFANVIIIINTLQNVQSFFINIQLCTYFAQKKLAVPRLCAKLVFFFTFFFSSWSYSIYRVGAFSQNFAQINLKY
jgi:hypothetical protein